MVCTRSIEVQWCPAKTLEWRMAITVAVVHGSMNLCTTPTKKVSCTLLKEG